ncbi:unnamed protein product [Adineta steineri]|uniref:Uncharacterized protein n=1 Tax=Adineta steineri TaxID=433720 RepID=A0A815FKK8_9BILA|nr:unnamed protein product [Adineta steineri]CAF1587445.1 unnamed protein product [Adineta steineri]
MSNCKLFHTSKRTCHSEIEIGNLFERHKKSLIDHKQNMINEINEWRENLICQIQKHIDKQKFLVEQEFKIQSNYLQIKHQEFLDTALIYEERKNREEVRQLLEQCHALRFELSAFDYSEQYIPFIQIKKEQQLIEIKPNSFNTHNYEKQSTRGHS